MSRPTERILLVDDEKRLLSGLRRNLGSRFHILTAESGKEALEILDNTSDIAVVLSDMQMPEMNGVELLKNVRKKSPTIRRLMLTGNADQETAVAAVNEGAVFRFLRKPCEPDVIGEALDSALEDFRFSVDGEASGISTGQVARDSFLSIMSHELRTPLNHIIGLSQLIQLPDAQEYEPSREFLSTLRGSADDLLYTVCRMLEYARLTSSEEASAESMPFDIVDLVSGSIDKARANAQARDITIALDSLPRKLDIDGVREDVAIAVRELIENAVKFSKPEGHVGMTIRTTAESVDLKITDNGVGIEEDALERIYGKFSQADESGSRQHGGIGLGLSLASVAVEKNGGSISISSEANRGTTAIISLPRAAEIEYEEAS